MLRIINSRIISSVSKQLTKPIGAQISRNLCTNVPKPQKEE